MKALRILESAEFVPPGVLGSGNRIANKDALLAKFRSYRRVTTMGLIFLYILAIVVAVTTVVMAVNNSSPLAKGLLSFVGGAAFVALLEFARRLTKDILLMALPLMVAEHASDEMLSTFVESLLVAFGKGGDDEGKPKGK